MPKVSDSGASEDEWTDAKHDNKNWLVAHNAASINV
jgi:hypothetical protein